MSYDVLVIGGGINGLAACYHLARRGTQRVGLIERFALGHPHGSSHGQSRITRSAYIDARYVRLMQVAHIDAWPQLERDARKHLIYPSPGCFFGPPEGKYSQYANAVTTVGVDVEPLTPAEGRKHFPMFRFENVAGILHDRTAGVIAAAQTIQSLVQLIQNDGVSIHDHTQVRHIDPSRAPIRIETSQGTFETERLIITAGPWAARLVPQLASRLSVARQTVGYFKIAGPPEQFLVGTFPVWGYLLAQGDVSYYGLPEFERTGIKLARHITAGTNDDPDDIPTETPEAAIDDLRAFLKAQVVPPVEDFIDWETCLYTNTPNENFIIDHHPDHPNIVIGAGFSGHGFKFGPLTGRILTELCLDGKTSLPEFENARSLFAFTLNPEDSP